MAEWAVVKKDAGVVHVTAYCSMACPWRSENYRTAVQAARRHVRTTGHEVLVDVGSVYRLSRAEVSDG